MELGEQGQEGCLLLEVLGLVPGLEVPWSRVRELALGCRREDRLALPLCLVRILGQEEEELVLASTAYWAGRGCLPAFSTPLPAQLRGLLDWREAGLQGVQVGILLLAEQGLKKGSSSELLSSLQSLVTSLGLPAVEEHLASCPAPQDWFLALPPPPLARRMSLTMQQVFSYSLPSSTKFTVQTLLVQSSLLLSLTSLPWEEVGEVTRVARLLQDRIEDQDRAEVRSQLSCLSQELHPAHQALVSLYS